MLIDYRAFFRDWESIKVAAVMIVLITAAKYIAALLTQKTFKLSSDQRTVIFGLSSAHVAATLAAVMVGYNVIIGQTPDGEPIRLLGESVLNGTILMILATCTISTFATQRGAHNIAIKGVRENDESTEHQDEHILIPGVERRERQGTRNSGQRAQIEEKPQRILRAARHRQQGGRQRAGKTGPQNSRKRRRRPLPHRTSTSTSCCATTSISRNAIASVAKEQSITDIVMGLHRDKSPAIFLGKITGRPAGRKQRHDLHLQTGTTAGDHKRHIVIIPSQAEKEAGFLMWLHKIGNLARNTGTKSSSMPRKQRSSTSNRCGASRPQP